MLDLLQKIALVRQHLGFQTIITHGKPGEGRTVQVERAIQTLRRQASTLMHMAEQKSELFDLVIMRCGRGPMLMLHGL